MKKNSDNIVLPSVAKKAPQEGPQVRRVPSLEMITKPTADFTKTLAAEIVKNLTNIGEFTRHSLQRNGNKTKKKPQVYGENQIFVDTSVLIDGRILPVVNSGFMAGTLLIPQVILQELQHIADSPDPLRRAKGRRGLEVVNKLKGQKVNQQVKCKIVSDDAPEVKEVDHKLVALSKHYKARLLTVDFNLASMARAQGLKVVNVNDLAQALKMAIVPGEELTIKITHEGKEREQGVGYLSDGTMIVVDDAKTRVGQDVVVTVTKVHQTAAGQLFFAHLR